MSANNSRTAKRPTAMQIAISEEPDFFGPPPLIRGENPADYQALLKRVSAAVQPRDFLDEIWVRDIVDLYWEMLRLRRLKTGLLNASMSEALRAVLTSLHPSRRSSLVEETLIERWANGERDARKRVEQLLAAAGFSMEEVAATALSKKLDEFERVDQMIATTEARRNNALREIDRHHAALGAALRAAVEGAKDVENAEDAEFTDVEAGTVTNRSAQ
jgi:hypothetical protein